MFADAESREPDTPKVDLWRLPEILSIDIAHVTYEEPRIHYTRTEPHTYREAVEFAVKTSEEFPVRALSPALYIGDAVVAEHEVIGDNRYRFYAFEFEELEEGAPISVGWIGVPEQSRQTRFRYEVHWDERVT